jgi:hypothetical protein
MSILSSLSTKVFAGSLAVVGGLGGIGAVAASNPTIQTDISNVTSAITSKDLSAYKTAEDQLINDKAQAQIAKVNSTTQDQLNSMADRQAKQTAVQSAITNDDYASFKANADTQMLKQISTQDAFEKLVASTKARAAEVATLDTAIKNNDSASYIAAVKADEASQPTNTDSNAPKRPTLTDAQIQAQFDKQEAAYKSNGTLPSSDKGMMGGGFGFGGGRGHGGPGGDMTPPADNSNTSASTSTSTSTSTSSTASASI